jgi:hypothetical protein
MLRLSEHKYLKWQSTMLVKIYVLSYCKYVAFHALILGRVCAFENDSSGLWVFRKIFTPDLACSASASVGV